MANLSNVTYTANGVTTIFVVPFSYIEEADIEVKVDDVVVAGYTFNGSGDIVFSVAPSNGEVVYIARDSDVAQRITAFSDGSDLTEEDLNNNGDQSIFLHQETRDLINTINTENEEIIVRVGDNEAAIATNIADIATNAGNIATNTGNISANDIEIAQNILDIATNASDIADGVLATAAKVDGAVSSVDNALPKYDGITGKILQDSGVIISDANDLTGINTIGVQKITASRTATADADNPVNLSVDAAGFSDVKVMDLNFTTGSIPVEAEESVLDIHIDDTAAAVGSIVNGIKVTTEVGNSDTFGILTDTGVSPIGQLAHTFIPMDSIKVNGVDKLSDISDPMTNTEVFKLQYDTMTIGNMSKFDNVLIDKAAIGVYPYDMQFVFEYSTGVGTFAEFTPTDTTNGWMNDGNMSWDISTIPLWAKDVNNEYTFRLTRNRYGSFPAAKLSVDQITIQSKIGYSWNDNGDISVASAQIGLSPRMTSVKDEDSMVSNDPLALATQQSIKAYSDAHKNNVANPHAVTKGQVGLGSVVNADTTTTVNITDSTNKRFMTDAQESNLDNQSGTNTGDQTATSLGLGSVDNTSDADKPISTATQTALDLKATDVITTEGDLVIGNVSDVESRLAIGTANKILTSNGTTATWEDPAATPAAFVTVEKTTTATLATSGEDNVVVDSAAGDFTVTLPSAVGNNGLTYKISKSSSVNSVTVDADGAEEIGSGTDVILKYEDDSIVIFSDNVKWHYASKNLRKAAIAKGRVNTTMTLASGSWTRVNFDTTESDTDSLVTTGASWKYTTPRAGIYKFTSVVQLDASGNWQDGETLKSRYSIDGVTYQVSTQEISPTVTSAHEMSIISTITLVIGADKICYLDISQNSGASINVDYTTAHNFILVEQIG